MSPSAGPPELRLPDPAAKPLAALPPQRVLKPVGLADPFRWLRAGWRDLRAAPMIALFYGLCFWGMALLLGAVFRNLPQYTMTVISGCFLVGPFLAMGLYEVSRRSESGLAQSLGASLTCWISHLGSMGTLVLVLVLVELLWGRASLVVFAVFFTQAMPSTTGMLNAIVDPQNLSFVAAYLLVGGIFAGLVFSTCVVAIPMILDRDTDAITAGLASLHLVLERSGPMLLWGALIVLLVLVALLLPWAVGLLLVGPWLGHASWHAYRGTIGWRPALSPATA